MIADMQPSSPETRRQLELLEADALVSYQLDALNRLLDDVLPSNAFYAEKLSRIRRPIRSLDELAELPFTFKEELLEHDLDANTSRARNLTYEIGRYVRFHQTSGTRGRPLVVLDTADDWQWWLDAWQFVLDAADVTADDRAMMAFSFGPFIGFWSAFEAAAARGCLVVPGGGRNTLGRLELMRQCQATVLFCTPSYALHMAEVAAQHQIRLDTLPINRIIVAGEPGGSVPATRQRIEAVWNATVIDHAGATEIGPWGYADRQRRGLHVNEAFFIAEFLSAETGGPAAEGELSELVLTTLGRRGCPVIRYRTGDLVRPTWSGDGDNRFVLLEGGILSRADDMMIIRGVNIFPSAIEQILRGFPEIIEYRLIATKQGEMDRLSVEIEDRLNQPQRVAEELQLRLGLKIDVTTVPIGTLPRFEGKGKRFIDKR